MRPKRYSGKISVGIVGIGRFGQAIARRLPSDINLCLADKASSRARRLAKELSASAVSVREVFSKSDVVLLILPPLSICPLVRKYSPAMKPNAILVNMATSVKTDRVRKTIQRKDIKIIGAKPVGQAYAISRGYKAMFISSTRKSPLLDLLKYLFASIGKVIVTDEMLAEKINAEATRAGLCLAIDLRKKLKKIYCSKEIIDVAVNTVAVGTIQDYPLKEYNPYIRKILKELRSHR